jgi:hypothetical protein
MDIYLIDFASIGHCSLQQFVLSFVYKIFCLYSAILVYKTTQSISTMMIALKNPTGSQQVLKRTKLEDFFAKKSPWYSPVFWVKKILSNQFLDPPVAWNSGQFRL